MKGAIYRLTGNTYPYRDKIKEIGGMWDEASKSWLVKMGTMRERARQSQVLYDLQQKGVRVELVED